MYVSDGKGSVSRVSKTFTARRTNVENGRILIIGSSDTVEKAETAIEELRAQMETDGMDLTEFTFDIV